ncbi:MAG: PAS domain-containing sensor histidine kinase [Euryarchaeota archaeon]|nr:PAS domain-containing sensor histidine kinase [Euryarchaeota archaeon]
MANELQKMIKELNCLYDISMIVGEKLPMEETLQRIVDLLPSALQYPDIACARICFNDRTFQTDNFRETPWKQSNSIIVNGVPVGWVEVFYLENRPEADEGPFLKDERNLITVMTRNISECIVHKQVEVALKESEKKYSDLFHKSNDAIFIHDPEGNILNVNQKTLSLFGYTKDEMVSINISELHPPEVLEKSKWAVETISRKGAVKFEIDFKKKNGKKFRGDVSSNILEMGGEKVIQAIVRDITERKQAEDTLLHYAEELERSNKLKDLFADIMRHDLLNPAGIVKGFTEVLLKIEEDEQKQGFLHIIKRNNEKLINMIENASRFSKFESMDQIELKVMDLGPIICKALDDFSPLLENKQMNTRLELSGQYMTRINVIVEEVFENLISNAIKYSPEGSDILIDIIDMQNFWKVTVTDPGEGIVNEDKLHIFDRFKRADKKGIKGTGLGLAIVKRIIELHGGDVGVEDNPQGQGSVFWVTLKKA